MRHAFPALLLVPIAMAAQTLTLTDAELENKIKGGWLGKSAGVVIGGPTEFEAKGSMYAGSINLYPEAGGETGMWTLFGQDDLFVNVWFLEVMDRNLAGPEGIYTATMRQYGEPLKNSTVTVWCGNEHARDNLNAGIEPPLSGMWAGAGNRHNAGADDIDFQIECDWIGLMCPSMPMTAMRLCDSVGHVMTYGDGLYGGYFVAGMEALAFPP